MAPQSSPAVPAVFAHWFFPHWFFMGAP